MKQKRRRGMIEALEGTFQAGYESPDGSPITPQRVLYATAATAGVATVFTLVGFALKRLLGWKEYVERVDR
jgi:hypothetical protein